MGGWSWRDRMVLEDGGHEIRYPRPEFDRPMDRMTRQKEEWMGLHVDNSDIKDIAEDMRLAWEEIKELHDMDGEMLKTGIPVDFALKTEKNRKELGKMIYEDFGLDMNFGYNDPASEEAIGRYVETWGNWEQSERVCKAAHRYLRAVCKNLEIEDLPQGERERWVNELAEGLYKAMKENEGDPAENTVRYVAEVVQDFVDEIGGYMRMVVEKERGMLDDQL